MEITLRDYQVESVNRVLAAYEANPHGRELLVLPTGCHRVGQGILMYDGTIRPVEEIQIGDLLMGPDSTPRTVLRLHRGIDDMVQICPVKGDSWIVNKDHILSLVHTNERNAKERIYPSTLGGNICDVSVSTWQTWSKYKKHVHKLYRVAVDFQAGEPLPMHPYLLGALLGDGGLSIEERIHFTNIDEPVIREVKRIVQESGFTLCTLKQENRTQSYAIRAHTGKGRPKDGIQTIKRIMVQLGLLPIRCESRFIPQNFKTASRNDRLELLAGLIDTDGSLTRGNFDYCSKSQQLANDVCFVARSLGLAAYKSPKVIDGTTYYRVSISGDCSTIPTRIPRKQAPARQQKKDVLHTGFTCKPIGTAEEYFGFTVDGNHHYLLDDFTVTHNCGKTVIFSQVIDRLNKQYGLNSMVIAHRDELLDQAADKYRMVKPDAIIGKVGSGLHQYGGEVTVASIATIQRPEHIKRLKAIGYGLIIVDEAHHVAAEGYQRVLEALPDAFVLMVTATEDRLDGKKIIEKPALYSASIIDMVQRGYLCDLKAVAIKTHVNLDDLHTQAGDYKVDELEEAIDTDTRNRRVVDAYKEHANGRRAICFGVTVKHAQNLAEAFRAGGISAAIVSGETPLDERKKLYAGLHDGSIKVLTNVQVLTEGFDEPLISCIIMARPTQSRSLYVQSIGRGLRLAPAKQNCIILDLTDNCLKHRLEPQNLKKIIGKDIKDEETLLEAIERETRENEEREVRVRKLKEKRSQDIQVNILEKLNWQLKDDGMFVLEVGPQKHRIAIVPDWDGEDDLWGNPGYYTVWARLAPFYDAQMWLQSAPLDWCQQYAEKRARMLLSDAGNIKLVDKTATWRSYPASEKQIEMLTRFGVQFSPEITKGEAADILDPIFEKLKAKREAKAQKEKVS